MAAGPRAGHDPAGHDPAAASDHGGTLNGVEWRCMCVRFGVWVGGGECTVLKDLHVCSVIKLIEVCVRAGVRMIAWKIWPHSCTSKQLHAARICCLTARWPRASLGPQSKASIKHNANWHQSICCIHLIEVIRKSGKHMHMHELRVMKN